MLYDCEKSPVLESELDSVPTGAIYQLNNLGKVILPLNLDFFNCKTGLNIPTY